MRRPALVVPLLALVVAAPTPGADPPKPPAFTQVQAWAGSDAELLGFTQEKLVAFLAARRANLTAARQPEWSAWLKGLEQAKGSNLRAWALTRRVEAGDYSGYSAFQDAITEHLLGISKPGSGKRDRVITRPPLVSQYAMPDALHIDHKSIFWRSLRKTLQESPDRSLTTGLYSVWCYGTDPDQKDLILEVATHVESPISLRNRTADPWNDPRFWIVVDWAITWGSQADLESIHGAMKPGAGRNAFDDLIRNLKKIPGFMPGPSDAAARQTVPMPTGDVLTQMTQIAKETEKKDPLGVPDFSKVVGFDFSQIKVVLQPPAPRYPKEATTRKMMTDLVLDIVVDPKGEPVSCRPIPGPWLGFFAHTGISYAMQWRFRAAELRGVPQYARFRLTMPFRLRE